MLATCFSTAPAEMTSLRPHHAAGLAGTRGVRALGTSR
jgi:hypothetical protein